MSETYKIKPHCIYEGLPKILRISRSNFVVPGVGLCQPSAQDGPIIVSYSTHNCTEWVELEKIRYMCIFTRAYYDLFQLCDSDSDSDVTLMGVIEMYRIVM